MKIAFPEYDNDIIKSAIEKSEGFDPVSASSLEEACELTKNGEADAIIAGIDYTTRDVVLACKNHLGASGKTFSSCFLFEKPEKQPFILADAGVTKNPTEEQLFDIVLQTYESAKKLLSDEPKIAMLSFSTMGSARDDSINKIQSVIEQIQTSHPEIAIDGEMQLDTATNPRIAAKKAPNSPVAGQANVLIVPDLNSGNILYKAIEQFGGYTAAGPILQGFIKPVSDLSRGSSVEDVLLVIDSIKKLAD